VPPINLVGDYGGGAMFLVTGILAALYEVRQSGMGQVIDCSMLEGSSYLMTPVHMFRNSGMWQAERGSNLLDSGAPFYRVYETTDGRHMAVGAIEDKFYRIFVEGLGLDMSKLPDPMNRKFWPELTGIFSDVFLSKTRDEWAEIFLPLDACVTPVLSVEEAIDFQHNRERESFATIDGMVQPNVAPRFSRTTVSVDSAAIRSGEHGREILEELNIPDQEIGVLLQEGVVARVEVNIGEK
jgi:alpha-methylacyl-CoA racemase